MLSDRQEGTLMETQFQPKVDVLIPVYKPDRRFGRLLQMLKEQTYQVNRIIVINTERIYWNEAGYQSIRGMEVHHISKAEFEDRKSVV